MNPTEGAVEGWGGEAALLARAKQIFVELKPMELAEREEALTRLCGGGGGEAPEAPGGLRSLVLMLLEGSESPLPFESLAEDIRAARDRAGGVASPAGSCGGSGDDATIVDPVSSGGSRIGNYRLLERLGEGGFGVVFMAEQERPIRRRVALKIIKLGMDTKQVVARFEAERQALALMDHPNIAKVFDAGATETGRPYFVMELVRGSPITEYCDRKKLTIRQRLELMSQVCDALQHAHQKGVIHRDIKPSNVLVEGIQGGGGSRDQGIEARKGSGLDPLIPRSLDPFRVKIIDFGIAKATSARLTEKTIFTEFRQMIGTPEYMSPEQAGESNEDVDTRTDVYSAGVLLYELLTGSTPFDSQRLRSAAYGEIQRIIREENPPKPSTKLTSKKETLGAIAAARAMPPAKLPSIIRGELDWIVMKALEKDRSRRYDSAGSMARDLQRYLDGDAVRAAPPSRVYIARKFVRRNKGPALAGSLLALTLVAGLIGTGIGLFNADRERTEAVKQSTRADKKADEALASEARASRSAYSANMLSACAAMGTNQFGTAKAFLEATPESLRGWEWRTLWSRLDTSVREIVCPMPNWKPGEWSGSSSLRMHPDGHSFFTVRADEVEISQQWDLATGVLMARFARPALSEPTQFSRTRVIVSFDGSRLLGYSGSAFNSPACSVAVWSIRTGECTLRTDFPPAEGADGVMGISPDGARLIRNRGTTLLMQDVATGTVLASGQVASLGGVNAFNTDGTRFAATDGRGGIELLDGRTLVHVASLHMHGNDVRDMDFSRNARWLASSSIDGTGIVWDLGASPPQPTVLRHPAGVHGIRLSPDASHVATSCADKTIRVWNASTGELKGSFTTGGLLRDAVMFMPDGHTVAGRERDGTVRLWDVSAESTVNLRGHKGMLIQAFFAEEAGLIVSTGWDGWKGSTGCIRLWDAQTGDEVAAIGEPGEHAYFVTVSPDGLYAAACITWPDSPWTPEGKAKHTRVELINLLTGARTVVRAERVLHPSRWGVVPVAFDPTSRLLAVRDAGRLDILDAATGAVRRSRADTPAGDGWGALMWSPDGRVLASARMTRTGNTGNDAQVWEAIDAASLASLREFETGAPVSWVFTPDSTSLCFGCPDGVVRRFNVASGKSDLTFQAHDLPVRSIAFNRDGTRLATAGGDDGDVIVWNTTTSPTFDRVARFHEDGWAGSVAWDATGERLLGTFGQTIRVWDSTPLRERVQARAARQQAVEQVTPIVTRLFEDLKEPAKVVERINTDASLDTLHRKAALQLVLKRGLAGVVKSFDAVPAIRP